VEGGLVEAVVVVAVVVVASDLRGDEREWCASTYLLPVGSLRWGIWCDSGFDCLLWELWLTPAEAIARARKSCFSGH